MTTNNYLPPLGVGINDAELTIDIDRARFALSCKTWRLRNGLTQAQAGAKLGITRYQVIRVERCKPLSWETTYRLYCRLNDLLEAERRDA